MKFLALFALAGLALAAPAPQRPGQAAASTTSAAGSAPSQDCYTRGCGGGYPWKREDDLAERAPAPEVVVAAQ